MFRACQKKIGINTKERNNLTQLVAAEFLPTVTGTQKTPLPTIITGDT
jgi:hypothetical protein